MKTEITNKLIQIIPAISQEATGPTYSVVRLCEELIGHGYEVTLAALDWGPMTSKPPFLKTFFLGCGPRRMGPSPAMKQWLYREIETGDIDIIHNHSLWMMPNVYPGLVVKKYKLPYIVSPRGTLSEWAVASGSKIKRIFWPLVQKPALEAVSCWHATAESEYEDIRRLGFRQPVAVIPNGINIPAFHKKEKRLYHTLLFLGRIHPKKGLDVLLPAWKAVQNRFPCWRLRIVGPDNGGYLFKMQRLASALGLQRIDFSGPLYGKDKWTAYQNADLFVVPSYSENFGMTVAEALASGLPAIVSRGAPWAGLETNRAGRWVAPGLNPLISVLKEMMSRSVDDLTAMGQRGRLWMEKDYSWKIIGQQISVTYRWILDGGKKPDWVFLG